MRAIIFALMAVSCPASATSADVVGQATGAALQADVPRALDILKDVDPASLPPKDAQFVSCMRQRFAGPVWDGPAADSVGGALAAYRSYWHASLMNPDSRAEQERRLDTSLRNLLKAEESADLDSLVAKRIAASNRHSLEGRTGLLRELMVWSKQTEKFVEVALPEGAHRVKVVLLEEFESFGWSHYATCGRRATGGWATDQALYAVVPRYESIENEEFRVTFLAHEAQHFADKARFTDLKPWEFEYRAKLTELALADRTRTKVLGKFIEDQSDDRASPHSFANRKVLQNVTARLRLERPDELLTAYGPGVQSAARSILFEDSRQRIATGQLR